MEKDISKIVEDYIKAIDYSHFQDFCDRLLMKMFKDYTAVRAGGRKGDMKNDGYCYLSRTFFQAHASRGNTIRQIKEKIKSDFEGCVRQQKNVKKFIYITNDIMVGEVEAFVDEIRSNYSLIEIETWGPKRIALILLERFDIDEISYIIDRKIDFNIRSYDEFVKTLNDIDQELILSSSKGKFSLVKDTFSSMFGYSEMNQIYYKKANFIKNFSIPVTKPEMLSMLNLCMSNYTSIGNFEGETSIEWERNRKIKKAWKAKIEQILYEAEKQFPNDKGVIDKSNLIKRQIGSNYALFKELISGKFTGIWIILFFMLPFGLLLHKCETIETNGIENEKERLNKVLNEINIAIKNKDYDLAETLSSQLFWEFHGDYSHRTDSLKVQWDKKRETLLNAIHNQGK